MDNPLKKILGQGMAFFKQSKAGESVVGIDLGSSSIKVVQLKKKGSKAVLETYGALSLGPYANQEVGQSTNLEPEKIAQALTDVMREAGVTTKASAVSIPASASLIVLIDLPASIDEKQIASIVPTEARKYIPVPISEISLDWWVIPKKDLSFEEEANAHSGVKTEQKTEVLIAAIHNDTTTKYRDITKKVDIDARFFEIEVFSSIRASLHHELSTVLLFDMGALKTKLSIIEYGIVKSFHVINRGSQDATQALASSLSIPFVKAEELKRTSGLLVNTENPKVAEVISESVDFILAETNTAMLGYEKKYNRTISKVILTGGGSLLKGFLEKVKENFRSEVVLGNPFSKVEAPAFLEPVLESAGPEFTVAAGLALRLLQEE